MDSQNRGARRQLLVGSENRLEEQVLGRSKLSNGCFYLSSKVFSAADESVVRLTA